MANERAPAHTAREIADELRRRVLSGETSPGERLATIAELVEEFGVARDTVRSAVSILSAEGLVRPVLRKGIVVQERVKRRRIKRGLAVTRNPHYGYVFPATSDPMEPWQTHGSPFRSLEVAPLAVTDAFGLDAGTTVLRRRRVTSPEGEPPFQIADTWISPQAVVDAPKVAEPSTGPGGYLDRLEEAGHGPIAWQETTRVRMPSREEAGLLRIGTSLPVFEITMVGTSARTSVPVEVTVKVIPGDRAELVVDLHRTGLAQWPVEPVASL